MTVALSNTQIQTTYGDVLQLGNSGAGVLTTLLTVNDGLGNATALQVSSTTVKANGTVGFLAANHAGYTGSPGGYRLVSNDGLTNRCFISNDSADSFKLDPNNTSAFIGIGGLDGTTGAPDIDLRPGGRLMTDDNNGQDLPYVVGILTGNVVTALGFGNDNAGGASHLGDTYFRVQTGKTQHWSVNTVDVLTLTSTALATVAGTWIVNTSGYKRTTSAPTNLTNTPSNLTDLSVTLLAGQKFSGRLVLWANNSTAAEGLQFDFNGGGATMTSFQAGFAATPPGAGLALGTLTSTALATALTVTTATTADACYVIEFSGVCNAAGTLIPRFAEASAHTSGTATVELNSVMKVDQSAN